MITVILQTTHVELAFAGFLLTTNSLEKSFADYKNNLLHNSHLERWESYWEPMPKDYTLFKFEGEDYASWETEDGVINFCRVEYLKSNTEFYTHLRSYKAPVSGNMIYRMYVYKA